MQIRCPACRGQLKLPKPVKEGTALGCPKCGHRFKVRGRAQSASKPASKPAPPPSEFDNFDDFGALGQEAFDAPLSRPRSGARKGRRKSAKKKSAGTNLPGWVLPVAVGGGGLAVAALTIIAMVMLLRSPEKPPGETNVAAAEQEKTAPETPAPKPVVTKTEVVAKSPEPEPLPRINLPEVEAPAPAAGGDGQLSTEVLSRVKKATVLLRVTQFRGEVVNGTGFFAVDKNIVITNAHVVGMLQPGTHRPRKVEIIVDSGEPTEHTLAGYVVAVDRTSDLAVLRYRNAAKSSPDVSPSTAPQPLKVFSAKKLLETQVVYVFGFPFGEQLGKNITVSRSSVSSLRKDKDGYLKQVQVNGGMHPGNSGGPVVDSSGNVIGIAVAGIPGTQVNFAIPGDSLYRMLEGRISTVTLGESYQIGKQFRVPVTLRAIDPLSRLKKVEIEWWVGKQGRSRGPADSRPTPLPGDSPHATVDVPYRKGVAHVFLKVPPVPEGKAVFLQPIYEAANGKRRWMASISYDPGPLLDQMTVLVSLKPKVEKSDLYLNSRSQMKFDVFGGDELSLLSHIDAHLMQNTYNVGRDGGAHRQFTVKKMEWGVSIDNKPAPRSLRTQQAMQYLKNLSLIVGEDPQGNLISRRIDVSRVPRSAQKLLAALGRQMMESLDLASVSIPGKRLKPGTNWRATRSVPLETPGAYRSGAILMRYIYKGVADYYHRRVAVINIRGTIPARTTGSMTVTGRARGMAYLDLRKKRIVVAEVTLDVNLIAKIGSDTAKASGQTQVKLSRLSPDWHKKKPAKK